MASKTSGNQQKTDAAQELHLRLTPASHGMYEERRTFTAALSQALTTRRVVYTILNTNTTPVLQGLRKKYYQTCDTTGMYVKN